MTVGFSERWSGNRVPLSLVVIGTAIGMLSGSIAALAKSPITTSLGEQAPLPTLVIAWMLTGSFIGLGVGLWWVIDNRARAAYAFTGGLLGGSVGGLILAGVGGRVPDLSKALAFVLTGVAICFGITLAPVLLREGLLRFISSGDGRAQSKLARKEWDLQPRESYVIGSESQNFEQSRYPPEVEIFIPDSAIAARHAILYGREGHFYIKRHPDASGKAGMARYQIRVRGTSVPSKQELHNSDDITIGRTTFEFRVRTRPRSN